MTLVHSFDEIEAGDTAIYALPLGRQAPEPGLSTPKPKNSSMENAGSSTMTLSERADELEKQLSDELDRGAIPVRSQLYTSG